MTAAITPGAFAAAVAHAGQFRKRNSGDLRPKIPYVSHLLGVASIVIEDTGTLDEAIAALLHDVLEDQDESATRSFDIEGLFGAEVLAIVEKCSGPKREDPGSGEFRDRKQVYLDHLLQRDRHRCDQSVLIRQSAQRAMYRQRSRGGRPQDVGAVQRRGR